MAQTGKSNGERRLVVTAVGVNRPGLASELIQSITKRGCLIKDCHATPLADCLTMTILVAGNWSALGRLETALPKFAESLDIKIQYQHADEHPAADQGFRPYAVEVIAPVRNDILMQVLEFFQGQQLRINELAAEEYKSVHTGAAMCTMSLVVHMPIDQHPQALRESFMDLCDELNADGILDPIKS